MRIQKLLTYVIALLLVASFSSCSKDKDSEPTKRALLTAQTWNGSAVYIMNQPETDLYEELTGVDFKKIRLKYDENGTYAETFERVTISGTWEFTNNEQSIIFDKGTKDEYTARIVTLTANEYIIERLIEESGYDPLPIEFRFTK